MPRTQSVKEKREYDDRVDALLDHIAIQAEENRELRLENVVLRSLLPEDAKALLD